MSVSPESTAAGTGRRLRAEIDTVEAVSGSARAEVEMVAPAASRPVAKVEVSLSEGRGEVREP